MITREELIKVIEENKLKPIFKLDGKTTFLYIYFINGDLYELIGASDELRAYCCIPLD